MPLFSKIHRVSFLKSALLSLALVVTSEFCAVDVSAQSRETLPATQDAYVDRKESTKNFGTNDELTIKKSKTGKRDRRCFFQFEVPTKNQSIQLAVLDCTITSTADAGVNVGVTAANWRESQINWDNFKGRVTRVKKVPALGGGHLLVDVTKAVQKARKADLKSLTFVLEASKASKATLRIASRENAVPEERPRLLVEFENDEDPFQTSITYTKTEKGTFAGLGLTTSSGEQSLGRFGGWENWQLEKSGFFHVEQLDDHWTLVDPNGHAFFGFGLNSVTEVDALQLPQDIQAIGFNHFGSWSDETIKNIPYTPRWNFIVRFKNKTPELKRNFLENDLMPVFEPKFESFVNRLASKAAKRQNDPWVLGHFTDNEIPFHKTIQLKESLKLPAKNAQHQAAKIWLRKKHGRRVRASDITEDDELEYMGFVADRYFQVVTTALRKHDPNHLILGERLHASAKYNPHVIAAAGKYCDIISINFYRDWQPPGKVLAMWRDVGKKPFLITEFYSKAADSGLANKNGAGWVVPDQQGRVQHFENFALQMLGTPHCIGLQWFRFIDDEGSNKGVYTANYEPYEQLQDSMKKVTRQLYRLRSKQLFGNLDFNGKVK